MDPRETGKPRVDHLGLSQPVLSEITLVWNRINKMSPEEKGELFASDPFKSLGFLDVRPVNLATVPVEGTIESAVKKQERELLTILKMPLPEETRRTAIVSFITLPTRKDQSLKLSILARSANLKNRYTAKRIIDQFQKDPKTAFVEMEKMRNNS